MARGGGGERRAAEVCGVRRDELRFFSSPFFSSFLSSFFRVREILGSGGAGAGVLDGWRSGSANCSPDSRVILCVALLRCSIVLRGISSFAHAVGVILGERALS